MTEALKRSVTSLRVPNYRRYFVGQVVSLSGNWMQIVAEVWLILHLTGSGTAVGLVAGLQFAPLLFLGAFGGLLADRFAKRRLLLVTQTMMAVPALALWGLTATGAVEAWMVYGLVFLRGSVLAIDNPARQSFVVEMVGADRVVNAVSLNSVLIHTARIVGPALAGVIITLWGVELCFLVNSLSFAAMLFALRAMDPGQLDTPRLVPREPGALRAAVRYVAATPALRVPLAMMALVGTLSFNFQVILPLLARFSFGGGPTEYASLMTAMGAGAVAGALITGARGRVSPRLLVGSSAAFGAFSLLLAGAPNMGVAIAVLVPLGAASVTFAASVNSALQISVDPQMRGRVMALYSVVFLGSTPIGGPLAGWVSETSSPRFALLIAGAAALTAALAARFAFARDVGENAGDAAADPDRGGHAARVRRAGLGRAEQPGRRAERGRGAARLARERRTGHTHPARER